MGDILPFWGDNLFGVVTQRIRPYRPEGDKGDNLKRGCHLGCHFTETT